MDEEESDEDDKIESDDPMDEESVETVAQINNYDYLYPHVDDKYFNHKISQRKEFSDAKYDGSIVPVEKKADELCNAEYELAPHQQFVRNFLSSQTPYNSMLLYHGLGSGKTCSAISVAEESRDYLKRVGNKKKIFVIASPNVQNNFRLQLFDERKLKYTDNGWSMQDSCIGNKLLREIEPTNMKRYTKNDKEKVVQKVNKIIDTYYSFYGYIEFSNFLSKKMRVNADVSSKQKNRIIKNNLNKRFDGSVVIVDEVHNVRTGSKRDKKISKQLQKLAKYTDNVKLLLLSATPMYNDYTEIIWLINLMNMNDNRPIIEQRDVFDGDGLFKTSAEGEEIGRSLLERKSRGYVSFVRGENPYTFPYRIWPTQFEPTRILTTTTAPTLQMNGKPIVQGIQELDLFMSPLGDYQKLGYKYVVDRLKDDETFEGLGYGVLMKPIEALNIVYPHEDFSDEGNIRDASIDVNELVGSGGLERIMSYEQLQAPFPQRFNYDYKKGISKEFDIFSPDKIGNYSGKIKTICDSIISSKGIVLVYSQYIDGGLVPLALALEQLGFLRAGKNRSLFKEKARPKRTTKKMRYAMITGDKGFSPNNDEELKLITDVKNKHGDQVKVVLISQAGSEGIDFKFIRQVHIMEPWFNMNRIEQIIGRAVRTCSHKDLEFAERNVEIYLHCSHLDNDEEPADMYIYRKAEVKAIKIGIVSRALKEVSTDCMLNVKQSGFTVENMNQTVKQRLSSGKEIDYQVGDKPFSSTCDYMERCEYRCGAVRSGDDANKINEYTYSEKNVSMDIERLKERIKEMMAERFFYNKAELLAGINLVKAYPIVKIYAALGEIIDNKEPVIDKFGRFGRLINIGQLYLFQPKVIEDENASLYDRTRPIERKYPGLRIQVEKPAVIETFEDIESRLMESVKNKYEYALKETNELDVDDIQQQKTYDQMKRVVDDMKERGVKDDDIKSMLVDHILEELNYEDVYVMLNFLWKIKDDPGDDISRRSKKYFSQKTFDDYVLFQINKDQTFKAFQLNKSTAVWNKVINLEKRRIRGVINKIEKQEVNENYRYMGLVKPEDDFKVTKVVTKKGNNGVKETGPQRVNREFEFRNNDRLRRDKKRWFLTFAEHGIKALKNKNKNK